MEAEKIALSMRRRASRASASNVLFASSGLWHLIMGLKPKSFALSLLFQTRIKLINKRGLPTPATAPVPVINFIERNRLSREKSNLLARAGLDQMSGLHTFVGIGHRSFPPRCWMRTSQSCSPHHCCPGWCSGSFCYCERWPAECRYRRGNGLWPWR